MRFLLLALLFVPMTVTAQQTTELETIETVLAVVDSAQQVYLQDNGIYSWHVDGLGLNTSPGDGPTTDYLILPWGVSVRWSGAADDIENPEWGIVLKYGNSMCWWPEKIFNILRTHTDKEVRGETLACVEM